jgi:hypothetical protein
MICFWHPGCERFSPCCQSGGARRSDACWRRSLVAPAPRVGDCPRGSVRRRDVGQAIRTKRRGLAVPKLVIPLISHQG